MIFRVKRSNRKGGPGSGNFDHAGRPGFVGGSASTSGGPEEYPNVQIELTASLPLPPECKGAKEALRLAGIPNDYAGKVGVYGAGDPGTVYVSLLGRDITMVRKIHYIEKRVTNSEFVIEDNSKYKGQGADIFAAQVETLANAGFKTIHTSAGRSDGYLNGYYTWARCGYVPENAGHGVAKARHAGLKVATFEDIMATPTGRAWWKGHGWGFEGSFSLAKNSYSQRTLAAYMKERAERAKTGKGVKGGPGSGNFGHHGRPGLVGGSAPARTAESEQQVLSIYQDGGYQYINGVARGNKDYRNKPIVPEEDLPLIQERIRILDSMIDRQPERHLSVVFRGDGAMVSLVIFESSGIQAEMRKAGLKVTPDTFFGKGPDGQPWVSYFRSKAVGMEFTDEGFLSTSSRMSLAKDRFTHGGSKEISPFGGVGLLYITSSKKRKFLDVDNDAVGIMNAGESEILLPRGTKLRVTDVGMSLEENGPLLKWFVEIVD